MHSMNITDRIAELTLTLNVLEGQMDSMTDEEHCLILPIVDAAQPLLKELEDLLENCDD